MGLKEKGSGVDRNGCGLSSDLGYKDTDWLDRARYGLIAVLAPVPSRSHTGVLPKDLAYGPGTSLTHASYDMPGGCAHGIEAVRRTHTVPRTYSSNSVSQG